MTQATSDLLYVHDYGQWHIAEKRVPGIPKTVALCGATHQSVKGYWASQLHYAGRALVLDDREVCSACLVEVWIR